MMWVNFVADVGGWFSAGTKVVVAKQLVIGQKFFCRIVKIL